MARIKISNQDVALLSNAAVYNFPKYTSQVINWANGVAQGTRPKVVGQMSELIQEFDGRTLQEWIEWYDKKMPNAIDDATDKIYEMLQKILSATPQIDKNMVREWVKDLVYTKTFCGLKIQQAVISHISGLIGKTWRLANKEEEAQGIDGFINNKPVQIKATTYKAERHLNEIIDVPIVYYEKKKDGLVIEFELSDFTD